MFKPSPSTELNKYSLVVKHILIVFSASVIASFNASAQDALNVDAVYPKQEQNNQTIMLTGTVEAKQHAQLAPLEAGRVATLGVEIGDEVTKGQQLLVLESKLVELEVQGASADVAVAEVNLKEAKRLYQEAQRLAEQKVVAKSLIAERAAMLASAEAQLVRIKASLKLRQERLNRHRLKAPFDGVIAQRNVDVGEWITPQMSVFTLVAKNDLRLAVEVPQQYYNQLSVYKQTDIVINVIADTAGVEKFAATLSRLVPVSDRVTRTFKAQIDLPNDATQMTGGLVVGMSAKAEIVVPGSGQARVVLPRAAIKQHPDGGSSVFIVDNNQAKRVVTDYTIMPNNRVAINNQPADQAYIITGVEILKDGAPITVNVVDAGGF